MEIFRRTPLDQGRLETCRKWHEFDSAVSNSSGGDTAADLWLLLMNYEPDVNDEPVARAALDALLDLPEIGMLRKACAGDPALSAAVTVMLKNFSIQAQSAIEQAEQDHEQEQQPSPGEGNAGDNPQSGDNANESDSASEGEGEPSPGDGSGKGQDPPPRSGSSKLSPGTEQTLKAALKAAAEKWIDPESAAERVDDVGAGFSLTGDPNPSLRDRLEIAASDTANMGQILKLVGVLRQTVAETGRYIRAATPDARLAKPGFSGGLRALGMLDNTEIADLTTPGIEETMFWQRWKNRRTRVTHSWGKVPAGAGPIVLMGDESSSMPAQEAGFPDTHPSLTAADWLVALALATAAQCEAERRPFVYQAWGSRIPRDRRFQSKEGGGLTAEQRIKMATEHAGGGTNLGLAVQRGIMEAVKLSQGRKVKADVLVVTDGSWNLHSRDVADLKNRLEETKIKVHLFLVCNNADISNVDHGFWTTMLDVKDLLHSSVAVGKIMA
jgi:hypothetical protein